MQYHRNNYVIISSTYQNAPGPSGHTNIQVGSEASIVTLVLGSDGISEVKSSTLYMFNSELVVQYWVGLDATSRVLLKFSVHTVNRWFKVKQVDLMKIKEGFTGSVLCTVHD